MADEIGRAAPNGPGDAMPDLLPVLGAGAVEETERDDVGREGGRQVRQMTTFGQRVVAERKRAGLTACAVAATAGISAQYLNDIERGRRDCPFHIADRIASALDCDVITLDPIVKVPMSCVTPEGIGFIVHEVIA